MLDKFDYSMVPTGYAHCFNGNCLKAGQCLRYQITRYIPDALFFVPCINPAQTCPEGDCPGFMTDEPLINAYGMTHLLDKLLYAQARAIKEEILIHYGKAYFYRLMRKERCFTPRDQQYVRKVFLHYGATEEPAFDSYQVGYQWDKR